MGSERDRGGDVRVGEVSVRRGGSPPRGDRGRGNGRRGGERGSEVEEDLLLRRREGAIPEEVKVERGSAREEGAFVV